MKSLRKQKLHTTPQTCNFIKKRLYHRCFPVNFVKFLRTHSFINHLWWLLLLPHDSKEVFFGQGNSLLIFYCYLPKQNTSGVLNSFFSKKIRKKREKHCTKMKFSIKDFFSKCDQIHSFLRIW